MTAGLSISQTLIILQWQLVSQTHKRWSFYSDSCSLNLKNIHHFTVTVGLSISIFVPAVVTGQQPKLFSVTSLLQLQFTKTGLIYN